MKETVWDRMKEMIKVHHTEKDLLNVKIIRGKDHSHLECIEGDKVIFREKLNTNDSIDLAIKFLITYRGEFECEK
jgi:hypothetical protein